MDALLKFARRAAGGHDSEILRCEAPRAGPSANHPTDGGVDAQPPKSCDNVTSVNTKSPSVCLPSTTDSNYTHPPQNRDKSAKTQIELAYPLRTDGNPDSLKPTLPNACLKCVQIPKDPLSTLLIPAKSANNIDVTAELAVEVETDSTSPPHPSVNQVSPDICLSSRHSNATEATKNTNFPTPPIEPPTAKIPINEQPTSPKSSQESTQKMKLTVHVPTVTFSVLQNSANDLSRNSSDQIIPTADSHQTSHPALQLNVESGSTSPFSQTPTSNPDRLLKCNDASFGIEPKRDANDPSVRLDTNHREGTSLVRGQRDRKKAGFCKKALKHLKNDENVLRKELESKYLPNSPARSSPKVSDLRKQTRTDATPSQKKSYLAVALQPKSAPNAPNLTQSNDTNDKTAKTNGSLVRPKPRTTHKPPWPQSRFPLRSDQKNRTHNNCSLGNRLTSKINDISKPNRTSAFDRVYNKNRGSDRPPLLSGEKSNALERIGVCIEKAEEMQCGSDPRVISCAPRDPDTLDAHIAKVEQELRDLEQGMSISGNNTMCRDYAAVAGISTASSKASQRPVSLLMRMEDIKFCTELARARNRERELLNQVHKLTLENTSTEKREHALLQDVNLLKGGNSQLVDKLSLLETLYLDQVEITEEQTKALHDLRQARVAPGTNASRALCAQSNVNHLRTEFHNLQNSYHTLAAENSMLHTKLKALTSSFRVASDNILSHVQVNEPAGDMQNNSASNCGPQTTNVLSSASQPVCARRNGQYQFAYPHGCPSSLGVPVVLPAA